MFPDFSGLVFFAVVGIVVLLGIVFPALGAGTFILIWHILTSEWVLKIGVYGAIIGLIPAIITLYSIIYFPLKDYLYYERERKKNETRND